MRSHGRVRAEIPARRAFLLVLLVLVLLVVVPRLRSRSGLNRRLSLEGLLIRGLSLEAS